MRSVGTAPATVAGIGGDSMTANASGPKWTQIRRNLDHRPAQRQTRRRVPAAKLVAAIQRRGVVEHRAFSLVGEVYKPKASRDRHKVISRMVHI